MRTASSAWARIMASSESKAAPERSMVLVTLVKDTGAGRALGGTGDRMRVGHVSLKFAEKFKGSPHERLSCSRWRVGLLKGKGRYWLGVGGVGAGGRHRHS